MPNFTKTNQNVWKYQVKFVEISGKICGNIRQNLWKYQAKFPSYHKLLFPTSSFL